MAKYLMRAIIFLLMAIVGIACVAVGMNADGPSNLPDTDPLNTTYTIEEQVLRLINGRFEKQAAPGSATRIRASVSGRPVFGDLDDDADDDAVVVIVYDPGGSGTFYYIAAAINQNGSYKGTSGFLLGDRITVKDVEIRKGVVFVQYADRRPTEPMSAPPLIDRSIQLILTGGRLSPVRPLIKQGNGVEG